MTLKTMPKVGDKLKYVGNGMLDMSTGNYYEITHKSEYSGFPCIQDDVGDNRVINEERFVLFELVEPETQSTGFVRISCIEATYGEGYTLEVRTDGAGFNTLQRLEIESKKEEDRRAIEQQIAQLQRKLEALK